MVIMTVAIVKQMIMELIIAGAIMTAGVFPLRWDDRLGVVPGVFVEDGVTVVLYSE